MSIYDGHCAAVCEGDLVRVIITNSHGVQVPEVGALRDAASLEIRVDLIVHCLQELVSDGVPRLDALSRPCKATDLIESGRL